MKTNSKSDLNITFEFHSFELNLQLERTNLSFAFPFYRAHFAESATEHSLVCLKIQMYWGPSAGPQDVHHNVPHLDSVVSGSILIIIQ